MGMDIITGVTARRSILVVAAAFALWASIVLVTGGFVIESPWGPLSSRAAIRPLIASALVALFYAVHLRQYWRIDVGSLIRVPWPPVVAAVASLLALSVGLSWGMRIAAGPDASGYIAQAAMLARGELTLPAPAWLHDAPWNHAALSAAPVGYTPSQYPNVLAPTYPPGLPLMMAAFQVAAGPSSVFFVVPILGAITVWASWLIGNGLSDPWSGAIGAVLVAMSSAFLIMVVQPMSDVPAAAFWSWSLASALRGRALSAGVTTCAATLVRPNLVALAMVPLVVVTFHERVKRGRRLLTFIAAAAPSAAVIGALHWYYHGSPFHSGYGNLGALFGLEGAWFNAEQYRRWFLSTQTAMPLVGLLAPAFQQRGLARLRTLLIATIFPCAVLVLYLPFRFEMPAHDWTYLRFMLPAYPSLMVGFSLVVLAACRMAPRSIALVVVSVIVLGGTAMHGWQFAQQNNAFHLKAANLRYARAVAYAESLPHNSVLISLAHSGTLRLYTGRDVLRFDAVDAKDIDRAIAYLEGRGHVVYLVGDPFEIDLFRQRFRGTRAESRLGSASPTDLDQAVAYKFTPQ